jgi:hypothetical protein
MVALAISALPARAEAFCGFYVSGADGNLYNNATQVTLMREGTRTVLAMQNNYQGPPQNFAMIVPVPIVLQKENVKTLARDVFSRVDQLAAPRLVEYWEQDPCAPQVQYEAKGGAVPMAAPVSRSAGRKDDLGVTVEAQFTVGEYEVVILSAKDALGLDTWLRREKYAIPAGAEALLKPYVQSGMKFFVAKVDVSKVAFGEHGAMLSPLRFHYDSETFNLPVRLGLINSSGTQDLIVHILAKGQRYEVANYPNVTVPTNLDVNENARGKFGTFYASLFDRTIEKNPKAVVTEYAWDASSCDPCPTPALTMAELATLGADALPSAQPVAPVSPVAPPGGPMAPPPPMGRGRGGFRIPSGFVLTRLHARYGRDSLGEDLVFRAAPPITGGRESRDGPSQELERGSQPGSTNNFQGRYAIRHPWKGKIECTEPRRGIWGGPPPGENAAEAKPKAATDLAFVPRVGSVQLASFVAPGSASELGLTAAPQAGDDPTKKPTPAADAGAPVPNETSKGGCKSCMMQSSSSRGSVPLTASAFAAGVLVLRRRRRRAA